jgi:hypothetical protein
MRQIQHIHTFAKIRTQRGTQVSKPAMSTSAALAHLRVFTLSPSYLGKLGLLTCRSCHTPSQPRFRSVGFKRVMGWVV